MTIIIAWIVFGIFATIINALQTFLILGAILFLFIEHRIKGWPKSIIRLKRNAYRQDMKNNWWLILLVGFGTQILANLLMVWFSSEAIAHIVNRLSLLGDGSINLKSVITLFIMLIFSTLGEELVFRDLLQNWLGKYIPTITANLIISISFGILHYYPGIIAVVLFRPIMKIDISSEGNRIF